MPGRAHGCPVEQLGQCKIESRELWYNCKYPLPGLVPGTHVLTAEVTKAQEDADGRANEAVPAGWIRRIVDARLAMQ